MSRLRILSLALSTSLIAAGVAAAPITAQDEAAPLGPPEATPNPEPLEVPTGDGTGVRLTTDLGDILIGLFTESAPVASENFVNLVEADYYDGIGFHRVVRDFVIQGGDPEGTGRGGPGYTIPDEEVVGEYGRGIVAMARTPEPDSQGSQFFIVLDDAARPALESANTYTIFGRVLEGMDVVDAIAERGPEADVIEDPVIIQDASIEEVQLPPEPTAAPPTASELAGAELEAMLPTQVRNVEMVTDAFSAEVILAGSGGNPAVEELTRLAQENDADISALAAASSSAQTEEVSAFVLAATVPGLPAELVQDPLTQLMLGVPDTAESSVEEVAGRQVTAIRRTADSGPEETVYVIASGDVVYFVLADPESREELFTALPDES